jgi:hypothetical protein
VVNLLGVTEPMVGWKQAPLSTITLCILVLRSVSILFVLKWNNERMHVFIHLRMISVLNDQVMCMHLSSCGLILLIDHLYALA